MITMEKSMLYVMIGLLMISLSGCTLDPEIYQTLNEEKINVAESLSEQISQLSPIELKAFYEYEQFTGFVTDVNVFAKIANENTGLTIPELKISESQFVQLMDGAQKYTPLIDPYNDLIEKSLSVDRDNPQSIEDFYVSFGKFSVSVFLVQSNAIHKGTFVTLGHINGATGIYKLRNVCGNACFGLAMKSAYWFMRDNIEEAAMKLPEWLGDLND
jgi:hypothetical protein